MVKQSSQKAMHYLSLGKGRRKIDGGVVLQRWCLTINCNYFTEKIR